MDLTVLEATPTHVRAGYACPCGCRPSVDFVRGTELVEEGCCCGNHFAVGPRATASLPERVGFRPESQTFDVPWGERLEAAWLVGPSVHEPVGGHDHGDHHHADEVHDHGPAEAAGQASGAMDPVCGMTVEPEAARAKGLHSSHQGRDYYFCGKGCKLDFDEDPERYLDHEYVPSM
jgi:YHS domain-containing protein